MSDPIAVTTGAAPPSMWEVLRFLLSKPSVRQTLIGCALAAIAMNAVGQFIGQFFVRVYHLGFAEAGQTPRADRRTGNELGTRARWVRRGLGFALRSALVCLGAGDRACCWQHRFSRLPSQRRWSAVGIARARRGSRRVVHLLHAHARDRAEHGERQYARVLGVRRVGSAGPGWNRPGPDAYRRH